MLILQTNVNLLNIADSLSKIPDTRQLVGNPSRVHSTRSYFRLERLQLFTGIQQYHRPPRLLHTQGHHSNQHDDTDDDDDGWEERLL